MLATLFDHIAPPEETRPARRLRVRRHECGLFVRKVKGSKYQLRWWLERYGSVNCGLYDESTAEMIRGLVAAEMAHHALTPLGTWEALMVVFRRLRRSRPPGGWPDVLPKWVKRDGKRFVARVKIRGEARELGPFRTPARAHEAMLKLLGMGGERRQGASEGRRLARLGDLIPPARRPA